jgi:hypothetical protein
LAHNSSDLSTEDRKEFALREVEVAMEMAPSAGALSRAYMSLHKAISKPASQSNGDSKKRPASDDG